MWQRFLAWLTGARPEEPYYNDVLDMQMDDAQRHPMLLFVVDHNRRQLEGILAAGAEFFDRDHMPYQGGVHLSRIIGPAEMVMKFMDAFTRPDGQYDLAIVLPKTNITVEIPKPQLFNTGQRIFVNNLVILEFAELLHRQERITHYAHY